MDEGYIKFDCRWNAKEINTDIDIKHINLWRSRLHQAGLIGRYDNGIGYGNISFRLEGRQFLISGSATGGLSSLDKRHYALVTDYSFAKNSLVCEGPVKASSESLSHAVIYECDPSAMAVIHIHSINLWKTLINKLPTTNRTVPYGTPEMAMEIKRLFTEAGDLGDHKTIIMGGHEEGILVYGESMDAAGKRTLSLLA